jgi:hypothetical protein
MKSKFIVMIVLILSIFLAVCYAQPASRFQSVGGDFARTWLDNFMAQNPKPAENNSNNSGLWNWGGSPKGRTVINGKIVPDPYYIWKSLNYTNGWLGEAYVDPKTGYPVYAYVDPNTGLTRYFYVDPNTGKAVYTNVAIANGNPDYSISPFGSSDFSMPASSYYTWVGNAPALPYNGIANYDNLGAV